MIRFGAHIQEQAPRCASWLHVRRFGDRFEIRGDREHDSGEPQPESTPSSACWRWSGRRLTIETDRLGLYPLYYFHRPDEFGISTSFASLARLRNCWDLDDDALSVFLRLQNFVGDGTPFREIRRVPPATTISWDEAGFRATSVPYHREAAQLSRAQAIDGFIDLFTQSMKQQRFRGRTAVLLSGGRDSRHVVLDMAERGETPYACVTVKHMPPRADEDARIAWLIAKRLGFRHVIVEQPPKTLDREIRKYVSTHFESHEGTQAQPLVDAINAGFDSVIDGFGGDFLSNGAQIDERNAALAREGRATPLALALFERFCPWFGSEAGIRALFGKRFDFDRAVAALEVELARHLDEPNPLASFYFWNRGRRNMAQVPCCLYARNVDVHLPYVEAALFDFLMSLPMEHTVSHAFHDDAIARAYPRHADIPYEDKRAAPQAARRWPAARMDLELALLAASRPSARLSQTFLLPRLALRAAGARRYGWVSSQQALYYLLVESLAAANSAFALASDSAIRHTSVERAVAPSH